MIKYGNMVLEPEVKEKRVISNGSLRKNREVVPVEKLEVVSMDNDYRKDMSELEKAIFKLENDFNALKRGVKVKGKYYGKKRGIVRTGIKEDWWMVKGAFGSGISDCEKIRQELVRLQALKMKG